MKWQPIEKYDKLKKKPEHCVFWFKEKPPRHKYAADGLRATINFSRTMGHRECTHYAVYEPPND